MSLNIKDAETNALAAEFAKATGESMTKAVTLAIKEHLEHVKRQLHHSASDFSQSARAALRHLFPGRLTIVNCFMTS